MEVLIQSILQQIIRRAMFSKSQANNTTNILILLFTDITQRLVYKYHTSKHTITTNIHYLILYIHYL